MKIEGDVFLDKETGKANTGNNRFDKNLGEALPGVEVTLCDENGNKVTITAQTGNNTVNQAKNETVNDAVGAVNKVTNNANKVTNKNETNTANNVVNNTTNKVDNKTTNTESKTKLPKAGTDSTVIFLVLGFVASAIYAYKKVSDYNV